MGQTRCQLMATVQMASCFTHSGHWPSFFVPLCMLHPDPANGELHSSHLEQHTPQYQALLYPTNLQTSPQNVPI